MTTPREEAEERRNAARGAGLVGAGPIVPRALAILRQSPRAALTATAALAGIAGAALALSLLAAQAVQSSSFRASAGGPSPALGLASMAALFVFLTASGLLMAAPAFALAAVVHGDPLSPRAFLRAVPRRLLLLAGHALCRLAPVVTLYGFLDAWGWDLQAAASSSWFGTLLITGSFLLVIDRCAAVAVAFSLVNPNDREPFHSAVERFALARPHRIAFTGIVTWAVIVAVLLGPVVGGDLRSRMLGAAGARTLHEVASALALIFASWLDAALTTALVTTEPF